MSEQSRNAPFLLSGTLLGGPLGRPVERLLERLSGLSRLQHAYEALPRGLDPDRFLAITLQRLGVQPLFAEAELGNVPSTGGAVLVANHPLGGLDGVLLAAILRRVRPDVRLLANHLLARIPELEPLLIGVDAFGGAGAKGRNLAPLREAIRWVQQGGLLVVFPAGEVSHLQLATRRVSDPDWHPAIARIVARTQAPVIPAYLAGRNSLSFQLAGLLHPRLRTALLPRELFNKAGQPLAVRIGRPLAADRLQGLDRDDLLALLRLRCYALAEEKRVSTGAAGVLAGPIAEPAETALLAAEVERLPAAACLAESGALAVYCTGAEPIPHLLQEIGRLRELTFRATGEGTGKLRDIDLYDSYYLHLFVWNRERRELVGAYRLGQSDRIVARYGCKGLYTRALFRFRRQLLDRLPPALELGRSFVRPEYQRSFAPLLLLWRGIGAYVAANPRYRVLFGPVSISADYQTVSRQLLVDFLSANNRVPELARLVRPRHPFRATRPHGAVNLTVPGNTEEVSRLLERLEEDGKGMPVLLRQYLKLGGRILGFNVDPAFANVLDGLIMVDLCRTEPKVLARYMGRAEAERFLAYHRPEPARAAG